MAKEELNNIKEEADTLNKKLAELTKEELAQVSGGILSTRLSASLIFEVDGSNNMTRSRPIRTQKRPGGMKPHGRMKLHVHLCIV